MDKILVVNRGNIILDTSDKYEWVILKNRSELFEIEDFSSFKFALVNYSTDINEIATFLNEKSLEYIILYTNPSSLDMNWYFDKNVRAVINMKLEDMDYELIEKYINDEEDLEEYKVLYDTTRILRLNLNLPMIVKEIEKMLGSVFKLKAIFNIKDDIFFAGKKYRFDSFENKLYDEAKSLIDILLNKESYFTMERNDQRITILPLIERSEVWGKVLLIRNDRLNDREMELLGIMLSQMASVLKNYYLLEYNKKLSLEIVKALVKAIEAKDYYTKGHSERVSKFAILLAEEMSYSSDVRERIEIAALLHDVGKIGVNEALLNKPGRLTEEEFDQIKEHSANGADIVSEIKDMSFISTIIKHHHERWDGMGYPDGLSEDEIPIESRIIAVADAYDAMTSDRSYREGYSHEKAVSIIKEEKGKQFDDLVVEAFLKIDQNIIKNL